MNPPELSHRWLPGLVATMDRFNQRHPWSHNDHFHPWIIRNFPERRRHALDVGCGHGGLVRTLSTHFDLVLGTDLDAGMRTVAARGAAGHPKVSITAEQLSELRSGFDLITMVAALHHMDAETALVEVRRLLAPGGRLMVVGLARPETRLDWVWDAICLLTNPVIGLAKNRGAVRPPANAPAYPTIEPSLTYMDLRRIFDAHLPGARLRRRIGFRYTAIWTKADLVRG